MLGKCSSDSTITYYCMHSFHNHSCFHIVSPARSHRGTARAHPGHTLRPLAVVPHGGMLRRASLSDPSALTLFLDLTHAGVLLSLVILRLLLRVGWVQRAVLVPMNRIHLEPGYVQNAPQLLPETSGSKPRGSASESFETPTCTLRKFGVGRLTTCNPKQKRQTM